VSPGSSLLSMADKVYDLNDGELVKRAPEQPKSPAAPTATPQPMKQVGPTQTGASASPQQPSPQSAQQPRAQQQPPTENKQPQQAQRPQQAVKPTQRQQGPRAPQNMDARAQSPTMATPAQQAKGQSAEKAVDSEKQETQPENLKTVKSKIQVIPPQMEDAKPEAKPKFTLKKRAKDQTDKNNG